MFVSTVDLATIRFLDLEVLGFGVKVLGEFGVRVGVLSFGVQSFGVRV